MWINQDYENYSQNGKIIEMKKRLVAAMIQ